MKKIFILISFIPILLVSCFEYDGRTSRALIKAMVHFPSDVAKIHVAVYDGAILPERLLLTQTATPSTGLDISVPAGELRMFLIVGEDYEGYAKYYGTSGPYSVSEDNTVNVVASMKPFASNFGLDFKWVNPIVHIIWNFMPGASHYTVMRKDGAFTEYFVLYMGPLNDYSPTNYQTHRVNAYYEIFNLYTVWSDEISG
jgi:hypothetical protein